MTSLPQSVCCSAHAGVCDWLHPPDPATDKTALQRPFGSGKQLLQPFLFLNIFEQYRDTDRAKERHPSSLPVHMPG